MIWNPYVGLGALYLAVALFAIGVLLTYSGMRLKHAIKVPKAGDALSVLILVCWAICVVVLLVSERIIRRVAPQHAAQFASILSGPIFPITLLSAIVTFAVVGYLCRSYGITVALGSAVGWNRCGPNDFRTSIRSNRDGYSEVDRIRRVALLCSCYNFNDVASFPVSCDKFVKLHTSLFRRNVHHFSSGLSSDSPILQIHYHL